MRLIVLVGIPGSGKSTWAAKQGLPVLSSDETRRLLTGDATNQGVNRLVFQTMRRMLESMLRSGTRQVIVDSTALTRKERRSWLRWAELHGCEIEAVYFDCPRAVCEERNAARDRVVPPEAMQLLFSRLEPPRLAEGFDRLTTISERATTAEPAQD